MSAETMEWIESTFSYSTLSPADQKELMDFFKDVDEKEVVWDGDEEVEEVEVEMRCYAKGTFKKITCRHRPW